MPFLFCWVPGHMGIPGNEKADEAAKRALNPLHHEIPFSDVKLLINHFIQNKWQESWDFEYKDTLHYIKPTIMTLLPSYPRKTDVLLTRLRIGHSRITHRHLLLRQECVFTVTFIL